MNRLITFLLLIFCVSTTFAQQQIDHVKRTYIDANGKVFINKVLPVYLWFTTSPTEKSDAILLKSEGQAKYSNPMYFDTEGRNNIKHDFAVDQETKQSVIPQTIVDFDIYVDGSAPSTSLTFAPAPKHTSGGVVYYGKGLTINLKSKDEISGVENIHYSVDAAPYQTYSATLPMDKEKGYVFKYYGSDNVGNAEAPSSESFTVDLSSPVTTHAVSDPKLGDIISPKATITLSFSDNLSGILNTKYDFDNKAGKIYSTPLALPDLADGDHSLTYYSTDNVLNEETAVTYKFYLDKTPPVVSNEIIGDQFAGVKTYISARTSIKLTATDNKAGVEDIFYTVDTSRQTTYSSPFLIPWTDGVHTIRYWGIDKVANVANKEYLTVTMDNTKPKTTITYGRPQFFTRDTLFINKNTTLTLNPVDDGAGILKTEYAINAGGNNTYSSSFKIEEEGFKSIDYYSTDKVNNQESANLSSCVVDNTPPVVFFTFSISPVDKKDGLNVYPPYTKMYLAATDKQVGADNILFSANGSPMKEYASPHTLDASEKPDKSKKLKKQLVKVITKDKLGNQAEQSIEFYIGY